MSWLSQFIHNPGQFITHKPLKALALLGAPLAAIGAPFIAPELGAALGIGGGAAAGAGAEAAGAAGLGELADIGAVGADIAGEGAIGLGTEGALGTEALGFAPEAASPFAGMMPENIPASFLGAASGTPESFYDAVGFGLNPADTAGVGVPGVGSVAGDVAPIASSTTFSPEMAAGAPFADSPVGQALVNAGLVDPAAGGGGMFGSAMNWIKANPLLASTLGLGGLGMLKNLIGGIPNAGALKGIAGQEAQLAAQNEATAQTLLGPIQGGPLPPALEQQVQNQLNAANVATKSKFAQLGLSGSTMETDAINNNSNQAQALRGTLAQQMAQAGLQLMSLANQELGAEAGIFTNLMNAQISQDNALEESIARFAGSAAMANAISSRGARAA